MNRIIIFLLLLSCVQTSAQVTQPKIHSLELYSGESKEGSFLLYEKRVMHEPTFVLDSISFNSGDVAFFSNNHGSFANLGHIHGNKAQMYAMRIRSGKLDLYEQVDIEVYGYESLNVPPDMGDATAAFLASGEYFEYYRKGKQEVKKANYRHLRLDLADNESSLEYLKKYRFYQFLQVGMIAAGAAITGGDLLLQDSDNIRITPISALGIVAIGCSFFTQYPKRDLLWQAVESYN
jgi:hypothetical protein